MRIQDSDLSRNANNFDAIRLIAASFVLIGHSPAILANKQLGWDPFLKLFGTSIHFFGVIIFFTISGFLVTRSWESKKHIVDFLAARILRIFPAVICVVLLSVFVLGTLLTTRSLPDYFSSDVTLKYLQDMTLYRMYYYLPGVFESNPMGGSINGSLWTLPYEFTCYLFLLLMGAAGLLRNKWLPALLFVLSIVAYLLFQAVIDTWVIPVLGIDFKHFFTLFLYFLAGSVYYQFRKLIPLNWTGLLICCIVAVYARIDFIPDLLLVLVLPYLIFLFSFSKKINLRRAGKHGDFSYGLFLYAFPVQQFLVFVTDGKLNLWLMILLSFLFTLPFAIASWKFIEKPALGLRRLLFSRAKIDSKKISGKQPLPG